MWTSSKIALALLLIAATARADGIGGGVGGANGIGNGIGDPSGIGGVIVASSGPTPCGSLATDFSVSTGCNMTAYFVGMR